MRGLRASCGVLLARCERVERENARLVTENALLRGQLEAARRAGKRQAAPFSKGDPKPEPGRPGRKRGDEHGRHGRRPVPERVDERIDVPVPESCPCCGGDVDAEDVVDQYQQDIRWVQGHARHYRIGRGRCRDCRKRVQGRHPSQTSDATGAAASQVGPEALAWAAQLNKEHGIAVSKIAGILGMFGVQITPGGLHQALGRIARAAEPTYEALALAVRQSAAVAADETGWRICGAKAWLWTFVGDDGVTVYLIATGRGYEQAHSVLGEDYAGVLERDGWAPYRRFEHARHQTCVAHLLRRTGEMIADSLAGQAKIPHAVRRLLLDALAVRDAHQDLLAQPAGGEIIDSTCVEIDDDQPLLAASAETPGDRPDQPLPAPASADTHGDGEGMAAARQAHLDTEIARLQGQLDALLARTPTHPPNQRLLKHLATEQEHLLTFLKTPGVQATNWRAEQAIRPAVVNRKNWGGNRTRHGADIQQTLTSVIRTSRQQDTCPIKLLADLQRQPDPAVSPALHVGAAATEPRGP